MFWQRFFARRSLQWMFGILMSACWIGIVAGSVKAGVMDWKSAVRGTGDLAWFLLLFTIFISLFHKLFPCVCLLCNMLPLRKQTGIGAFLIAGSHAVLEFLKRGIGTDIPAMASAAFSTDHAMIFGSIAFLIMLPIFLTSTNWMVVHMGYAAWKWLQRMTHIAFIFAALHIALIGFFYRGRIEAGPLVILGIYAAGYAYVWGRKLMGVRKVPS